MSSQRSMSAKIIDRVTRPMSIGMREAVMNLQTEIEVSIANGRGKRKARAYSREQGLCLHLGSGKNYKEGWVNVDIGRNKVDLTLDLRRTIPLPDGSCKIIFSEHVFEHFTYPEPATSIINDWFRLLEPGGTLNLVVPDGEMVVTAYSLGGSEEFYEAQKLYNPGWCLTKMDFLNFAFRQQGEHKHYYDFETLSNVLDRGGFVNIRRRSFDPSLDTKSREVGSLYVICEKPL